MTPQPGRAPQDVPDSLPQRDPGADVMPDDVRQTDPPPSVPPDSPPPSEEEAVADRGCGTVQR